MPPSRPAPDAEDRVILIERCEGFQVGQGRDQYSAYWVSLPTASSKSGLALAERLLKRDAPWSRDLFGDDAWPDLVGTSGGFGGSVAGPRQGTLVIVRNTRGVQTGSHNVQCYQFRIRVADVSVLANRQGATSVWKDDISRLRENTGDQAALLSLAEDVARAASRDLVTDLTVVMTRDVARPQAQRSARRIRV